MSRWIFDQNCKITNSEVGSDDDDDEDEDEEENQEGEEDCEDCDEEDSEVEDEEVTLKWPELVQLYLLSSEDLPISPWDLNQMRSVKGSVREKWKGV